MRQAWIRHDACDTPASPGKRKGDKKSQPGFAPGSQGTARPCGTPGLPIAVDQGPVGGDPPDLPCGIPHDDSSSGPDTSLV
ncbi:MAG TPA: hypothetical protein HA256_01400 [Methanoregulaceae archaeon]|nr:hypothetical protein [Methanoregulaceae archaeon]